MAQLTSLSAFGLPGKTYNFSAKSEAPVGGPHNPDRLTELGLGAWPGRLHSFAAKTPDIDGAPHDPGRITTLMPYGVSGRVYTFTAKARVAVVFPTPIKQRKQKAHGWNKRRLIMWGGRFPPKC